MILGINTCISSVEVALLDKSVKKNAILHDCVKVSKMKHMETLFDLLKKIIENRAHNIKKIVVVVGPGAFTSIRVGVTAANSFAYELGCKLYAIDMWTLYGVEEKKLPIYISAGKEDLFELTGFQTHVRHDPALLKTLKKTFYGELNEQHLAILSDPSLIQPRTLSLGQALQKLLKENALARFATDRALPYYIKEPNISVSKKII